MKNIIISLTIMLISQSVFAQILDWKFQVTQFVQIASTSANPVDYVWDIETNDMQGVQINLNPTEIVDIYIEANNAKIDFNHWIDDAGTASSSIWDLQINIDNAGYYTLYNGSAINNYVWNCSNIFTEIGTYNIKIKNMDLAGSYLLREYNIVVVPKSESLFRDQYKNCMRLWKSNELNAKPIILSSGFDAYNIKTEQYYRSAGNALFNCLLENGYDVYVVYYKYNGQDLRNNAAVYSSAVRYVSEIRFNSKNVISAGISMGGVISRYALIKAENDDYPLPVDSWISIDAPHQGAVISEDLQNYLKDNTSNEFDKYALECKAAKIMLNYNTYDASGVEHVSFYNELHTLNNDGFPHNTYNIGITFSTDEPNPNNGRWLEIRTPLGAKDADFELSPEEKIAGSFLPELNKDPYTVIALWGLFWGTVTMNQISSPTFIPHASALDFDQNSHTQFDEVIKPSSTGLHTVIPPEIIDPLLNALKYPKDLKLQNIVISGNASFYARNSILAGNDVIPSIENGDVVISPNSNVLFQATNYVKLMPGFMANSNFIARIESPDLISCSTDQIPFIKSTPYTVVQRNKSAVSNSFCTKNQIEPILFPNPVLNEVNISFGEIINNPINIKVFNSNGLIVINKYFYGVNSVKLDVSLLLPAIYTLTIDCINQTETLTFIKQ